RLVRRVAGAADRRDAEGEPRTSLRFAEVRLQVRVELDEARHYREVRRVDDGSARVVRVGVSDDAGDLVAVDHDVDVRARGRRLHVDELPGVHDDVRSRDGRRVLQVHGNGLRFARLDVDDPQLVDRLIQNVARVAGPARRVGALGRHVTRWAE